MVIQNKQINKKCFDKSFLWFFLVLFGGYIVLISLINSLVLTTSASALTYGSSTGLEFSFNSTLGITFTPNTGFIIDSLSAGNYAYSNTVTVSVSSNASDGFILSATVGKTDDNDRNNNRLVHANNTNYFESIPANADLSLSNLGTNKWGYSTYDTTNEAWSNYNGLAVVGSTGTTLISADTASEKTLDMRIGASSSANQVAGTFSNDINFTATANVVTYDYSITYNANNSSTVTNMPTNITNASYNTGGTIQISNTIPSATNASFLGWCDGTVSDTTCTGTLYQPGDYLKLTNASSSTTNNISLSAVWEVIVTIADGGNMQDISSKTDGGCPSTLTEGQAYTVTDARDGKSYRVARLTDGNCWMLDNLALDITAVSLDTLKGNTNADDTSLTYLKNGSGSSPYATAGVSKAWISSVQNYYDKPVIAVDSTTSGGCKNAYCVNGGSADSPWSYNSVTSVTINNVTSVAQGKIGVYYNYCAASAGSYCYGSDTSPSSDPDTSTLQDVKEDICPKGWRLPTSTLSGEFQALYTAYNSDYTDFQTALSTPLSGNFNSGWAYDQGSYGYFWSSTWYNTGYMYRLRVNSSNVTPSNNGYRGHGISIRCILAE